MSNLRRTRTDGRTTATHLPARVGRLTAQSALAALRAVETSKGDRRLQPDDRDQWADRNPDRPPKDHHTNCPNMPEEHREKEVSILHSCRPPRAPRAGKNLDNIDSRGWNPYSTLLSYELAEIKAGIQSISNPLNHALMQVAISLPREVGMSRPPSVRDRLIGGGIMSNLNK